MQLHGLAHDQQGCFIGAVFGATRGACALAVIVGGVVITQRFVHHRGGQGLLNIQIDRAVLQSLEAADGFAKLLPGTQVIDGDLEDLFGQAKQIGAGCQARKLAGTSQRVVGGVTTGEQGSARHHHLATTQRGGTGAIGQGMGFERQAGAVARAINQGQLVVECNRQQEAIDIGR